MAIFAQISEYNVQCLRWKPWWKLNKTRPLLNFNSSKILWKNGWTHQHTWKHHNLIGRKFETKLSKNGCEQNWELKVFSFGTIPQIFYPFPAPLHHQMTNLTSPSSTSSTWPTPATSTLAPTESRRSTTTTSTRCPTTRTTTLTSRRVAAWLSAVQHLFLPLC